MILAWMQKNVINEEIIALQDYRDIFSAAPDYLPKVFYKCVH